MKRYDRDLGTREQLEVTLKEAVLQFKAAVEREYELPDPSIYPRPMYLVQVLASPMPRVITESDLPKQVRTRTLRFEKEKFFIGLTRYTLWIKKGAY